MEIPSEYYTERGVEPPGLSYCAAEYGDWDSSDWEAAHLATEIDAAERAAVLVPAGGGAMNSLAGYREADALAWAQVVEGLRAYMKVQATLTYVPDWGPLIDEITDSVRLAMIDLLPDVLQGA